MDNGEQPKKYMLQQNVNNIESISMNEIMDMKYHKAGNPEEASRINMVAEMIKVKLGKLQLENFNNTEIDQKTIPWVIIFNIVHET